MYCFERIAFINYEEFSSKVVLALICSNMGSTFIYLNTKKLPN